MTDIMPVGSGKQYFTYKQGVFYKKSDDSSEVGYATREFEKRDGTKEKVSGVFASGIGGIITGAYIREIETDNGDKFKTLNVELDGDTVLSFGLNSEPAEVVMRTLTNVDVESKTVFIPYQKDGWNKLSVKQNNEHVEDSFVKYDAETNTFSHVNGYPERADKDASDAQKKIVRIQQGEFLEEHFNKNIATKFKSVEAPNDGDVSAVDYPVEDINPEDIPF